MQNNIIQPSGIDSYSSDFIHSFLSARPSERLCTTDLPLHGDRRRYDSEIVRKINATHKQRQLDVAHLILETHKKSGWINDPQMTLKPLKLTAHVSSTTL